MKEVYFKALSFILVLVLAEVIQFFIISDRAVLGGDFLFEDIEGLSLLFSLFISITIWIITFFIFFISHSKQESKLTFPVKNIVLLIYVFNLVITVTGNVGNVLNVPKSQLSFLTTLIPINYLILMNAQHKSLNTRFGIALVIFVIIDLHRLLLGGFMKVLYILAMRLKRRFIILVLVCIPLILVLAKSLVRYKLDSREIFVENLDESILDIVSSRLAIINTVHYIVKHSDKLSDYCHTEKYSPAIKAAALSVIPKRIFGIDYVKTNNNCIIEYHVGGNVDDSSVNAPWFLTLYLEWKYGYFSFLSYLFFTLILMVGVLSISNYLFGREASIFNLLFIFEFMWTGSILHLSIPFYFLTVLLIFYKLKRNFFGFRTWKIY